MTPMSNPRSYSRFIPSEEVGAVRQWKFGAVDGSDLLEPDPDAEPAPELPLEPTPAEQEAMLRQALDDAHEEGFAQGQAQTALEWQRRMDEYVATQGAETAQRMAALVAALDQSLNAMQQDMATQVLELACALARQVVRQELATNPNALQPVVREAVGTLVADGRPAIVKLNPSDLDALAQPLREELDHPAIQWVADPAVPAGGCLVESAGMVIDGTVERRWTRAVATLGLQVPWDDETHEA